MNERVTARNARPLIIVGALRSGTTLIRLMLNEHSRLHVFGEFEESVKFLGDQDWIGLDEYERALAEDRVSRRREWVLDKSIDYSANVRRMLAHAVDDNAGIIGFTIHSRFDRAIDIWPRARFIHIVRDPRPVAVSGIKMGWAGTAWHGCRQWVATEERFAGLRASLPREQYHELCIEEPITHPVRVLHRCCDFIGVAFEPSMLDYPDRSTYGEPDPAVIDRWKSSMSERQVGHVQQRCGDLMEKLGYEIMTPPGRKGPHGSGGRAGLELENRMVRFRWSVSRYGLWLALGRAIWRRVPLPYRLSERILKQAHAIDEANLQ